MSKKRHNKQKHKKNSHNSRGNGPNSIGRPLTLITNYFNSLVSSSAAAISTGVVYFYLNDTADTAAYTTVFDQYRVNWLEALFIPTTNLNVPGVSPETNNYIISVLDFDDSNTLSSVAQALSYSTAKIHPTAKIFRRRFIPCYDLAIGDSYGGAVTTNAIVKSNKQWINTNRGTVRCFGLKYLIPQTSTTNVYSWDVFVKASLSFRATR
jgi:hypothetical protein